MANDGGSIYAHRTKGQLNNRLEPDYIACDVCGFPCFTHYSECPNCGSVYFRADPMRPDGMMIHSGAIRKYYRF